ncbi:MAG: pyruvate oxidoreductase subunit gamma [Thermoprotei archaeon]|nr:MAG: pyruvate oxidoreductase subunit gamma [Thermoprotei archaeon]
MLVLSRGGQGGVTAARILASAIALEGRYAQAIPHFGAERRGAIVRSYLRVSEKSIRKHSSIKRADAVIVFSRKILDVVDISQYLRGDTVIVNSSTPIKVAKKTFYVDATNIALKLGLVIAGWPVVNTAMVGATAKALKLASLDSVLRALREYFSGNVLKMNEMAVKEAYNSVQEVK